MEKNLQTVYYHYWKDGKRKFGVIVQGNSKNIQLVKNKDIIVTLVDEEFINYKGD